MANVSLCGRLVLIFCVWSSTISNHLQAVGEFRKDYKFHSDINGWLKFHRVPSTWNEAKLKCYNEGAVLASPLNVQLYSAMRSSMLAGHEYAFTGIQSLTATGDYFSVEGIHLEEMSISWAKGEPNNLLNEERCLAISREGGLADVKCSAVFPYMCYREKRGDEQLTECGTHDKGYERVESTGSCYKYHPDCVTWARAQMVCAAEGGTLAILNSAEETNALMDKYGSQPIMCDGKRNTDAARFYHVGFHNPSADSAYWFTLDGKRIEDAGYSQWLPGNPNNVNPPETCGTILRPSGLLNDMNCGHKVPFICEMSRARAYLGR